MKEHLITVNESIQSLDVQTRLQHQQWTTLPKHSISIQIDQSQQKWPKLTRDRPSDHFIGTLENHNIISQSTHRPSNTLY